MGIGKTLMKGLAQNTGLVRVLVVDDHPIVREGLIETIKREADMEVCGEAESVNEGMAMVQKTNPDFVILDISLKGGVSGIELVKHLRNQNSKIPILVLSMHDELLYAERAIRAGAMGYITKQDGIKNLVEAMRKILNGEIYISSKMSTSILSKYFQGASDTIGISVDILSDREFEVFQLLGHGFSTSEISKKLNLTVSTIETYRAHIKDKFNLRNASELVKLAVQWVITEQKV
jgi:DNA-binding NarL/FixJ family response regulator